jgi:hypothetical protein
MEQSQADGAGRSESGSTWSAIELANTQKSWTVEQTLNVLAKSVYLYLCIFIYKPYYVMSGADSTGQ